MPNITLETEESTAAATKFDNHATTVQGIISEIETLIVNGLPGWQGGAKEAFVTQFTELKPHMQKFVTLVSGQAQQLRAHTENVVATDEHAKSQIGAGR